MAVRNRARSAPKVWESRSLAWAGALAAVAGVIITGIVALGGPNELHADIVIGRVEPDVSLADWMEIDSRQPPEYWNAALSIGSSEAGPAPSATVEASGGGNSSSVTTGPRQVTPEEMSDVVSTFRRRCSPLSQLGCYASAKGEIRMDDSGALVLLGDQIPGVIVTFRLTADGFAGRSVPVTWTLYDAVTDRRVAVELSEVAIGEVLMEADSDQWEGEIWIPIPVDAPGPFTLRLKVTDDRGEGLVSADSASFPGA